MTLPTDNPYRSWTLRKVSESYVPSFEAREPEALPLNELYAAHWTFQKRPDSDATIARLMDILEAKGCFADPIVFLRLTSGTAILIDGHHRANAASKLGHTEIWAVEHTGSLEDGILLATRENNLVKAPIGSEQAMDYAWLWFLAARPTPRKPTRDELMRMLGISKGSIDNLRRVYRGLLELEKLSEGEMDILDITTWKGAQDALGSGVSVGFKPALDREEAQKRRDAILGKRAAAVAKSFGGSLGRLELTAEVMAKVLTENGLDIRKFLTALSNHAGIAVSMEDLPF